LKDGIRQRTPSHARGALLALALAACAPGVPAAPDAERELERVRAAIAALERELGEAREQRGAASRAIEAHERAIDRIAREQRGLERRAQELAVELERLHGVRLGLLERVRAERHALARHLRVAYALGREDRLRLLLQGRDAAATARLLHYHRALGRARGARIEALESTLARVDATEQAIAIERGRLERVRAQQQRRRAALAEQRARREAALAALDAELSDAGARLRRLERDATRLAALIAKLRDVISDIPRELEPPRSFEALRGRLPWPVQGRVARRFGTPRSATGLAWQGVVLEAPAGREVRAVAHGRVVFADWLRGFGLMVILDHGNGYMSLYGHNESLLREPGEWVSPGDPLATVGDSGSHARAGLYFEIRRDGRPQDPGRWCDARARFRAAL